MQLSLSGRLVEIEYRTAAMGVPEFLHLAHDCSYQAVELRATQMPAGTTVAQVSQYRQMSDDLGLSVSCCMPPGITADEASLGRLEEFSGLAQALNCTALKVWVSDVAWLRRACDLVRPNGMSLLAQVHTGGPFETVTSCLETVARLERANFGLQYDPANLLEAQHEYGEEAVKRLVTHIKQVSVQSIRPALPGQADAWEYQGRYYRRCLLTDPAGLDYASVFRGLRAVGFAGYVTLNEPQPTSMAIAAFARRMNKDLRGLLSLG